MNVLQLGVALSSFALVAVGTALFLSDTSRAEETAATKSPLTSEIRTTAAKERILIHRALINAPASEVWKAYTTDKGYAAWAATQASIDLRVGGEIQTRYDKDGKLGDEGTNRLRIVNYVPNELLTLQAQPAKNWPPFLSKNAKNLYNVVLFRRVGNKKTEVISYGTGYGASKEYDAVLGFFKTANEKLLGKLKIYVEGQKK